MKPHQLTIFNEYPTYEKFMQDLSPEKLLVVFSDIIYVEQSVSKVRLSLGDINNMYSRSGFNPALDYMIKWIEYLAKFSNLNPLVETRAVAFMICDKFSHLYLTDLKLAFEKIIRADYGKLSVFFGSIDAQRLMYSFNQYDIERNAISNKYMQKLQEQFSSIREKIEETEKIRIHAEMAAENKKGDFWNKFLERCHKEIPPIVQAEWDKFINKQHNDKSK